MQSGRRKAHYILAFSGIIGTSLTMVENFNIQLVGRFIYGFAAGFESVASPRFIEEYVPHEYGHICIAIYTLAQNFGILLSALMALILPPDEDKEALALNNSWRIMFGLPFVFYGGMIIGLTFLIRYDSPKYYITNERKEMAIRSIQNIYITQGSDRKARQIYNHLETKNTGDTSDVTLR